MKIGINALFFRFLATGSGQYLTHLLEGLGEIDSQNKYYLFGPDAIKQEGGIFARFPYIQAAMPGFATRNARIEKLVWEQWSAPKEARKAGVDILHVPYFAPPYFSRVPCVVTIHDVIPLRLPAYRASPFMRAYLQLVSRAAHRAAMVITISQHAKQDIMDALKIPAERIRVIYEAAGDEYRPISDPETLARVRAKYGVGERFIFYLGGLDQRKNVPQLVRAFAHLYSQMKEPGLQLLIAGNPDKQRSPLFPDPRPVAADLGMRGQIIYRFIDEEDKPAVYSAASLFVFPSLYEGFGLDPLEAMKCGTPVVCSNRTSLPEVVGDAALTFDPDNIGQMVAAMRELLTDADLAAKLRERSLERAKQFSWRKTAAETLAVYEEVYKKSKK
ncbi:MAG TPA: glycosyltransferase family 1 protein [Ktedonobacteraceae bacterium]|jgi:glycosyltransferase involved in cell wall biosynthesis|nr:glycosyltransferase family 1 protein [Ktedonobacteraceae bacterium]